MHSVFTVYLILSIFFSFLKGILAKPITGPGFNQRQTSLADCLAAQNVPASIATSSNWSSLVTPYNLRLAYTPAAITLPTTIQQVTDSIKCAASSGVKVQAKSGGHSYASFSSGGQNGSLIIDLQAFNSISVDNATGIATVGGGVRLGNLALGIYSQGQRALPHGTCPGVGIGGHFTHGGYGYDSRAWGLALDTIVALDVVLANGTFITTSSTNHPEVFFALRGAAESFGIVTTFYLQTVPAPDSIINFSLTFPSLLSSATETANAFSSIQTFAITSQLMTRNLTFGFYIDSSSFSLNGWYIGGTTFFTDTVLPAMISGFPTPSSTSVKSLSWLDSLGNEAGGSGTLAEPLSGYNAHDTFYAKSITTRESHPLTTAALESFFNYVINQGKNAPDPWFSIINLYGGLDSQINTVPVDASAYSDRDSLWVFQNYGYTPTSLPPFNTAIIPFIDGLNNALTTAQPDGQFGAYLNYIDPELTAQQAADLYYGAELYAKLSTLKSVLDPDFVIWNPLAIGVAADGSGGNFVTSTTGISSSTTFVVTATGSGAATTSSCSPRQTPTSTLVASPDGTCGGNTGYTCIGSPIITVPGVMGCCSQYGWCGVTEAYCGVGCQGSFGRCDSLSINTWKSIGKTILSGQSRPIKRV